LTIVNNVGLMHVGAVSKMLPFIRGSKLIRVHPHELTRNVIGLQLTFAAIDTDLRREREDGDDFYALVSRLIVVRMHLRTVAFFRTFSRVVILKNTIAASRSEFLYFYTTRQISEFRFREELSFFFACWIFNVIRARVYIPSG
jgi:hypothetical protein